MDTRKSTRPSAFTLVELLVVIAIIALLLSILMPALQKVRLQASSVVCKSRMKDIGMMFHVYMQDNANMLPPDWCTPEETAAGKSNNDHHWFNRLAPYYRLQGKYSNVNQAGNQNWVANYKLFKCPTQEKWSTKYQQTLYNSGYLGIFGYLEWFAQPGGPTGNAIADNMVRSSTWWKKPERIKQPSDVPLMEDQSCDTWMGISTIYPGWDPAHRIGSAALPHPLAFKYGWLSNLPTRVRITRYSGYGPAPNHGTPNCNFLMADMHVDARNVCVAGKWPWIGNTPAELSSGKAFHPTRNVNATNDTAEAPEGGMFYHKCLWP